MLGPNLDFRRRLIAQASNNAGIRAGVLRCCRESLLFFCNVFGFVFEPRDKAVLPFITWPFQDDALLRLQRSFGRQDLLIPKTRDMGVTWMALYAVIHAYLFDENTSFMLVSKKEDLVKKWRNPDSLYWKINFALNRMPTFLLDGCDIEPTEGTYTNLARNNTIDYEASTGDAGRGGRRTGHVLDEFPTFQPQRQAAVLAATQANTNCRVIIGTPKGDVDEFARMVEERPDLTMRLLWTLHPKKADGLYYVDGQPRSPWYDEECRKPGSSRTLMAREVDINFLGSSHQFFDPLLIKNCRTLCKPPLLTGELNWNRDTLEPIEFVERADGPLSLWMPLMADGRPQSDRLYGAGCDIAHGSVEFRTGRGATNSVCAIGDMGARQKAAELVVSGMSPIDFARYVIALCKWFRGSHSDGAYLIWEDNGPGQVFRMEITERGYWHFFWRRNLDRIGNPAMNTPGWWTGKKSKKQLLENYAEALRTGNYLNLSSTSIDEMQYYVHLPNEGIGHHRAQRLDDPSGARENHSDRVIADALLVWGMLKSDLTPQRDKPTVESNTFWTRRQERRALAGHANDRW